MRGKRSRDSAGAVSRSKGLEGVEGVGGDFEDFERAERAVRPERAFSRASSTAAIWRSSAARAAGDELLSLPLVRCTRTAAPRSATAEKNRRALRSDGVGTPER